MKTLHLIKFTDHIQLGHLYEHIFLMQLGNMLRSKGLYAYIDFATTGNTFYDGALTATISLYSKRSQDMEPDILSFTPEFNQQSITSGLLQISAEKIAKTDQRDDEVILRKLNEYQAPPWQLLELLSVHDTTKSPKSTEGLTLKKVPGRNVLYARQHFSLLPALANRNRKVYVPIFYLVSHILIDNFIEILATECAYYSFDNSYAYKPDEYRETNTYLVYDRHSLSNEIAVTRSSSAVSIVTHSLNRWYVLSMRSTWRQRRISIRCLTGAVSRSVPRAGEAS